VSDHIVPSYRVRPQRAGFQLPWRMLAMAGAVIGAAAVGGVVVWGVSRAVNQGVPTIEADNRPIRVKPDDPGGMRVANQDERIFESARRAAGGTGNGSARLSPEAERPDLNALRQAARATPPAPPAAVPAPAPDAPPVRPPLANPSLGQPAAVPAAAPAPQAAAPAPPPAVPQQAQPAPPVATPAITPPPMPANAPTAAAPGRGGRFVVQLGAVTSEEAAQGEWARLQGRIPELAGRQPQVTRVDRGDLPPLWRIRTGGLPDAAAAQALCTSAKAKGAPCAVIGG